MTHSQNSKADGCIPKPPIDPDGDYGFEGHKNQMWEYPCGFMVSDVLALQAFDDSRLGGELMKLHEAHHD